MVTKVKTNRKFKPYFSETCFSLTSDVLLDFGQIPLKCIVSLRIATSNVEVCFLDLPEKCVIKILIGEKGYQIIALVYNFLIISKVQHCLIFLSFNGYHFLRKSSCILPILYWVLFWLIIYYMLKY